MVVNTKKNSSYFDRNPFYFVSDEALATILNFDLSSYKYLHYQEFVVGIASNRKLVDKHNPIPSTVYTSKFHAHLERLYRGSLFGYQFSPERSLAYCMLVGFYFLVIWKLGGGRRFHPLVSSYNKCNYFGFYDLAFTPLAIVVSFYTTCHFVLIRPDSIPAGGLNYRFLNSRHIFLGATSSTVTNYWLLFQYPDLAEDRLHIARYLAVSFFSRLLFFFPVSIFHFFVRPFIFWFSAFIFYCYACVFENKKLIERRGLAGPMKPFFHSLPYDLFWKKVYFNYFLSVDNYYNPSNNKLSRTKSDTSDNKQPQRIRIAEYIFHYSRKYTYNDLILEDDFVFSRLIYYQANHHIRKYRHGSPVSVVSGLLLTPVIGSPFNQRRLFFLLVNKRFEDYKFFVIRHALSIPTAAVSRKSADTPPTLLRKGQMFASKVEDDRITGDFTFFVWHYVSYFKIFTENFTTFYSAFFDTLFYKVVRTRSWAMSVHLAKFTSVLLEYLSSLYRFPKRFFHFFFILVYYNYFYTPQDVGQIRSSKKEDHSGRSYYSPVYFLRSKAKSFFSFLFHFFDLLRLYILLPLKFLSSSASRLFSFFERAFFLQSFYTYFYYFKRFFYSNFFTRLFTREIDDDFDQISEMMEDYANIADEDELDSGSANFEFSRFNTARSGVPPFDYFNDSNFIDRNIVGSTISENFLAEDKKISENRLLEQLFWGWISIGYCEDEIGIGFELPDREEIHRFYLLNSYSDSYTTPSDVADDFQADDEQTAKSLGDDDAHYEEDEESWTEDYFEEYYYDPKFSDSYQRYYDYFLGAANVSYLGEAINRYRLQLDAWRSSISHALIPIPREFLLIPSHLRRPQTLDDWKILTTIISTIVLSRSEIHALSASNNVQLINVVWRRFFRYLRSNPDALYEQLDSSSFERNYAILEQRFSKVFSQEEDIRPSFTKTLLQWLKGIFPYSFGRLYRFSFNSVFSFPYAEVDFSNLDYIFFASFPDSDTGETLSHSDLKKRITRLSRLEVLSVIFYLRFLADYNITAFYRFISSDIGVTIWSHFEAAIKLSLKYSPTSYDYVQTRPSIYHLKLGENEINYFKPLDVYSHFDTPIEDDYNNKATVGSYEDLFLLSVYNVYRLFNPYSTEKLPFDNFSPIYHPGQAYGFGFEEGTDYYFDEDESSDPAAVGSTSSMNILSSVFFDSFYTYLLDPTVSSSLFPFVYDDFIEDVFDIDEEEFSLDLYDQYLLDSTPNEESLDSLIYYVNEGLINEDVSEDIDYIDPTNDDLHEPGYMDMHGPQVEAFNSDDQELIGDFPFYAGDLELYMDDSLESGNEEWEPEESESFSDLAIPLNRLFFGTISSSSHVLPGVDPRLYSGKFLGSDFSDLSGDNHNISYSEINKSAFANISRKSLAIYYNTSFEKSAGAKVSPAITFTHIIFSNVIYFYFFFISFIFNISFYTYVNDINHLKNARVMKHFSRYQHCYQVPSSYVVKLKDWVGEFESFNKNSSYTGFKNNVLGLGSFFTPSFLRGSHKAFSNFFYSIPYVNDLFDFDPFLDEDAEFKVYSSQDYEEFERFDILSEQDVYDNSRFHELDILESYDLDDLLNSMPLDRLFNEEIDWDAGADLSYTSDDLLAELQVFNSKVSIALTALSSFYSLLTDYCLYFINSKYYLNIAIPFSYFNTRSDYEWARLAAKYGNLVYFFRYTVSSAVVLALFIYFSFIFPRIFYWFFVHSFNYGFFHFTVAFFSFLSFFATLLLFFPNFSAYYKNFNSDERLALYALVILTWFYYSFGGYAKAPWSIFGWMHPGRYANLSTEPDIVPRVLSLEPEEINTSTVEAAGRYKVYSTLLGERGFQYAKVFTDITRRRQYINFDYTAAPLSFKHFYDFVKYNVFGYRNYNLTGYKYMHVVQEPMFVKQVNDGLFTYFHRQYMLNLGGVPARLEDAVRLKYGNVARNLSRIWPMYWYSTNLSNTNEFYTADPTNFIFDPILLSVGESHIRSPYDFRSTTFYSVDSDFYEDQSTFSYGSKFAQRSGLLGYNLSFRGPRNKIVLFRGQKYLRSTYLRRSPRFHKRRITNYVYRYGRVGRFRHTIRQIVGSGHTASAGVVPNWFYLTLSKPYFNFIQINRGHFLFEYSNNFYKYILYKNFRRSKNYIDFFTFRPSQLYPRPSNRRKHTQRFNDYFNLIESAYEASAWSDYDQFKTKWDEVEGLLDPDEERAWLTKSQYAAMTAAEIYHFIYFRSIDHFPLYYPNFADSEKVSSKKKYKSPKNPRRKKAEDAYVKGLHRPLFNFARYSRFVSHYNQYLRITNSLAKDNYYVALATFIDKYSGRFDSGFNSYRTFVSGLGSNGSKIKYRRSPVISSRFSRDPSRRVRRRFKNARKDLLAFGHSKFDYIQPFPDVSNSNYSFLKKYARSRYRRKYTMKRRMFSKRFSNHSVYRFPKRRRYRRIIVRLDTPMRYQRFFSNYKIYKSSWHGGLRGFNRSFKVTSPPNKALGIYEKKIYDLLYTLGDNSAKTVLSGKLDVPYYNVPHEFLLDYYNPPKPNYDYYRYSPLNYAYSVTKLRLLDSDKIAPSIFYLWGFDHDPDDLDLEVEDFKIMGATILVEDFNRSKFFSTFKRPSPVWYRYKNRLYKHRTSSVRRPYFYRYLYIGTAKRYRRRRLIKRLKKAFTEEYIKSVLIKPVNLNYPLPPIPKRKYIRSYVLMYDTLSDSYVRKTVYKPTPLDPKFKRLLEYEKKKSMRRRKRLKALHMKRMRALPAFAEKMRKRGLRYKRLVRSYDVDVYRRIVEKHRNRRQPLLHFLTRRRSFLGDDNNFARFNEELGEAQIFLARENRRKKAALKELRRQREERERLLKNKQLQTQPLRRKNKVSENADSAFNSGSSSETKQDKKPKPKVNSSFRDPFNFLSF